MDYKVLREYCLSKKGAVECYPFDEVTTVFKVGSKMFGITNRNDVPLTISLKCDPYMSQDLRTEYSDIMPGYHLNKQHWNTIVVDSNLDEKLIFWLIDMSYDLVFKGLSKKEKTQIKDL